MRVGSDSIVIEAELEHVFRFVTDPRNDPKWHTTVVTVEQTSTGPMGVGATFRGIYQSSKRTLDAAADPAFFQPIVGEMVEFVMFKQSRLRVHFANAPRGFSGRVLGRTFDLTFRFEPHQMGTRLFRPVEIHPAPWMAPLVVLLVPFNGGRGQYLLGLLRSAVLEDAAGHIVGH